nr:MAG TPA: lysozyme family protein [Caudoviricetes sp.]
MTSERLVSYVKEMAGYGGDVEKSSKGITYYSDRWGYVLGGQGEVYTKELAYKWAKQERNGKTSDYYLKECAKWFGRRVVDCSGMIVEAIRQENVNYKDRTANMFRSQFSKSGSLATMPEVPGIALWKNGHIGIYIGNGLVVESRGYNYGVVVSNVVTQSWKEWGYISGITYIDNYSSRLVKVLGGSVYVRTNDDTTSDENIVGVAHRGDMFIYEGSTDKGWHKIEYDGRDCVISNRSDLTTVVSETTFVLTRLLKYTSPIMSGEDVRMVQTELAYLGFNIGKTGVDGKFGKNTASAVREFQKEKGLVVDGIVGEDTIIALGGMWKE